MYSLYIDTHFQEINLVLYKNGLMIDKEHSLEAKQSTAAMPLINSLINKNDIKISDIKEIICITGPGSFTGVRIGVTISKMLGQLLEIKIKAIDYLQVMSYFTDKKIVAVQENNGAYIWDRSLEEKKYEYLDQESFCKLNQNEIETKVNIEFDQLYTELSTTKEIIPHAVNPLYIKKFM